MDTPLKLSVVPESVRETNGYLHGICGIWAGQPVPFMCQPQTLDILIPESLEPIYPAIEEAILRYLRETGRMP